MGWTDARDVASLSGLLLGRKMDIDLAIRSFLSLVILLVCIRDSSRICEMQQKASDFSVPYLDGER